MMSTQSRPNPLQPWTSTGPGSSGMRPREVSDPVSRVTGAPALELGQVKDQVAPPRAEAGPGWGLIWPSWRKRAIRVQLVQTELKVFCVPIECGHMSKNIFSALRTVGVEGEEDCESTCWRGRM
ncbi:hypothetical protein DPEC_G00255890 [Dallia pectoralis]|uniref:Uncharacterized protein n=1 Tax=Dallia pectoralis TaxID=75939 RepID=A0ACC2FUQ7_DALPE|nr:hypothetical protein DPEC_G00255890 [Dallia pectoralis]